MILCVYIQSLVLGKIDSERMEVGVDKIILDINIFVHIY